MLSLTMLHVVGQQCCVLLANNVASVCMGLNKLGHNLHLDPFIIEVFTVAVNKWDPCSFPARGFI